jgi:hypothetical protein
MKVKTLRSYLAGLDGEAQVFIDLYSSTHPQGRAIQIQGLVLVENALDLNDVALQAHYQNRLLDVVMAVEHEPAPDGQMMSVPTVERSRPSPDSRAHYGHGA